MFAVEIEINSRGKGDGPEKQTLFIQHKRGYILSSQVLRLAFRFTDPKVCGSIHPSGSVFCLSTDKMQY